MRSPPYRRGLPVALSGRPGSSDRSAVNASRIASSSMPAERCAATQSSNPMPSGKASVQTEAAPRPSSCAANRMANDAKPGTEAA